MQDVERLIEELLARDLRPNTREQLQGFRKELAAGTLSEDDARYIRAFHARVAGGGAAAAPVRAGDASAAQDPSDLESIRAELAQSRLREQALTAERDRLQKLVDDLRKELDAANAGKT